MLCSLLHCRIRSLTAALSSYTSKRRRKRKGKQEDRRGRRTGGRPTDSESKRKSGRTTKRQRRRQTGSKTDNQDWKFDVFVNISLTQDWISEEMWPFCVNLSSCVCLLLSHWFHFVPTFGLKEPLILTSCQSLMSRTVCSAWNFVPLRSIVQLGNLMLLSTSSAVHQEINPELCVSFKLSIIPASDLKDSCCFYLFLEQSAQLLVLTYVHQPQHSSVYLFTLTWAGACQLSLPQAFHFVF